MLLEQGVKMNMVQIPQDVIACCGLIIYGGHYLWDKSIVDAICVVRYFQFPKSWASYTIRKWFSCPRK